MSRNARILWLVIIVAVAAYFGISYWHSTQAPVPPSSVLIEKRTITEGTTTAP